MSFACFCLFFIHQTPRIHQDQTANVNIQIVHQLLCKSLRGGRQRSTMEVAIHSPAFHPAPLVKKMKNMTNQNLFSYRLTSGLCAFVTQPVTYPTRQHHPHRRCDHHQYRIAQVLKYLPNVAQFLLFSGIKIYLNNHSY